MRHPKKLFVYGTLRMDPQLESTKPKLPIRIEVGHAMGHLYDLGPFPAAVFGDADVPVEGQLQDYSQLDDMAWARHVQSLDTYEGRSFDRKVVTVKLADGTETEAWAYEFNEPEVLTEGLVVPDGRWPS